MRLTLLTFAVGTTALFAQPTWTPQQSGAAVRLRGISAVSDTVAWASGAGGTVLRTTDGGRAWSRVVVPDACKPASSTALLTCALGTGGSYSMP